MGKIIIIAKNIVENASGTIREDAGGNIINHAGGRLIQTAEKGIIYGKYQKPKPPTDVRVTKLEGPFVAIDGEPVDNKIELGKSYVYKASFTRKPSNFDLGHLKWAVQYDDGEKTRILGVAHFQQLKEDKVLLPLIIEKEFKTARIYAYFRAPSKKKSVEIELKNKYPKVYISTTPSGYTIQKLYGHPAAKSLTTPYEPAVVVSTYKAYLKFFEDGETKDILEFNVTRDAWWYLGIKDNKYKLLNRTFEPLDGSKNKYLTDEIHFPSKAPDKCKGYFLKQNEKRIIDAEPFETEFDVDNKIIADNRKQKNQAENVMLHIGGVYKGATLKGLGIEWLGGSLGCFSFIPKNDIYTTPELAKKASENDDYDDDLSNSHWLKITNKINELRGLDPKKRFFIIINKRKDWIKTKVINFDELLKE